MTSLNCERRGDCTGFAFIASIIIGVIAAFLQITAVFTLTPVFSIVAFGIAILYLAILLLSTASIHRSSYSCACASTRALLLGIAGTILASVILLLVTFAATSVIGAIIVGVLFFSFALLITSTICLINCLSNCQA